MNKITEVQLKLCLVKNLETQSSKRKPEEKKINETTTHFKKLEKGQQIKPKESMDIIKEKAEINEVENKYITEKMNKAKNWSLIDLWQD